MSSATALGCFLAFASLQVAGLSDAAASTLRLGIRAQLWQGDRGAGHAAFMTLTFAPGRSSPALERGPTDVSRDQSHQARAQLAQSASEPKLDENRPAPAEASADPPTTPAPAPGGAESPALPSSSTPGSPLLRKSPGGRDGELLPGSPVTPVWLSPGFAAEVLARVRNRTSRDLAHLQALEGAARTSAWLPELRVRAGRSADQSLSFSPTVSDPNRWLSSGGADLRYEAQATWDLYRLLFSGSELGLERARHQYGRETEQRVERALDALFKFQRARLLSASDPLLPQERLSAELDALQAQLRLDALTGGWFSKRLSLLLPSSEPR